MNPCVILKDLLTSGPVIAYSFHGVFRRRWKAWHENKCISRPVR